MLITKGGMKCRLDNDSFVRTPRSLEVTEGVDCQHRRGKQEEKWGTGEAQEPAYQPRRAHRAQTGNHRGRGVFLVRSCTIENVCQPRLGRIKLTG